MKTCSRAPHDDADRGVAAEQHRQAGDRRRHHVGELVGRPSSAASAAAVARRSRASCSAVTSRTVASSREGRLRPPSHQADPHRADHPATVAVPQRRLDRARCRRATRSARATASAKPARRTRRSATSHGYGCGERPVGRAPAEQLGEPVVDLEHGAVEVEDEQGVVQAVE